MQDSLLEFCKNINGFDELKKSNKVGIIAYYLIEVKKTTNFSANDISGGFRELREIPYSNIPQFLKQNSDLSKNRKRDCKFLYNKKGYLLSRKYESKIKEQIQESNSTFLEFEIDVSKLNWKPDDIPYLNNSVKKHAHFFTKIYFLFYHLENSIRKFLTMRLTSILGTHWENILNKEVNLNKAQAIKKEVDLTNMLPNRGDNILFYCMWDDYAEIMKNYPHIFQHKKEASEIIAHLGTITKIRNAIAHNVATIPKEYQDELTVFLNKYIKVLKKNES
jgi:hypothetical protein